MMRFIKGTLFGITLIIFISGCSHKTNSSSALSTTIPRTFDSFRFIGSTTTVQQVFASVGLPDREIGSGIAIYDYQLSDGSHIWIGTADDTNIMYARHGTDSLDTAVPLF